MALPTIPKRHDLHGTDEIPAQHDRDVVCFDRLPHGRRPVALRRRTNNDEARLSSWHLDCRHRRRSHGDSLLLLAGWNNTAYYPSTANLQSSLTIVNSCSSKFTLSAMSVVSLLIPFVLAYIFYAWRAIDSKKIDREEIKNGEAY